MELEEGKIYTTQQMQKFMGISKSTWDHRRDELLENFCLYYEYEVIYEGRSTKYHIIRKLGDYQMISPEAKVQKEIIDNLQTDLTMLSNEDIFIYAFRLGARLMLDVLGEYKGQFYSPGE